MSDVANTSTTQERAMTHEDREREERLKAIQLEALGFRRRDRISTDDYGHNSRLTRFEQERIERAREVNKVGSDAFAKAQENQGTLSGWNNAWKNIAADAATEMLDSLEDGQSHRASLTAKLAAEYVDDPDEYHRDGRMSGRGGREGAGGRGGGVMGTRGRGSLRPMEARATGRVESSGDRQPISFVVPKKGGAANTSTAGATRAQQWKENRTSQPPLGLRGNAPGRAPFQHTAGSRDRMQHLRAVFGVPSRATAAAPGSKKGKNQPRNPSPDYESRLASPEAFMAAGVRIFSKNAAPSPVTTAPAGKQPPQAASTLPHKAPSIRSPAIETQAPFPVVRLPPVAPSKATGTTQQTPPSEETTKSRRKSVRFAEVGETTKPKTEESIFGAQVDQAPVGTPTLYTPPVKGNPTSSAETKGSYLDDLLGLDIEPDIAVGETEDAKAGGKPDSAESQNGHQQQGAKEDKSNEEALMQRESKNIQYILASLKATGLASKEIIAYYQDRVSAIKERMSAQTFSGGKKAETPSARIAQTVSKEVEMTDSSTTSPRQDLTTTGTRKAMTDLSTTSSLRNVTNTSTGTAETDPTNTSSLRDVSNTSTATANKVEDISTKSERLDESNDEQRSVLSERNDKTSSDGSSLAPAKSEPRTASKPTVQIKAQANISPLGLPPLPVIDLRASLWQDTVGSLPSHRTGGLRGAWGQLLGEDLIGERVLPGRPDPSQATRLVTSAGTALSTVVTEIVPISSNIPTSTAPALGTTRDGETPISQMPSVPTSVAAPHPLSSATSISTPITTYHKAESETPAAQPTASGQKQQSTKPVTEAVEAPVPTIPTTFASVETTTSGKSYPNTVARLPSSHDSLVARQRDQGNQDISHNALPQRHAHQSTITTSLPSVPTTEDKNEATPSQVQSFAQSFARPNITGRVLPNIPDNAITRQYARTTSSVPPTASTVAAVHDAGHTPEPTTVTQLEDSLKHFHITGSLQSSQPQTHTVSRQSQQMTANTTLASSIHQTRDNIRSTRRGAAPMVSPFLQSLQNARPLPTSGVGSATFLQYKQGPTPAAKVGPASRTETSSEPPPQTSETQASAKDAWGRVRRAGN